MILLLAHYKNPWKILVICILSNQANRKQVDAVRGELFRCFPSAASMAWDYYEPALRRIVRPLGMPRRRARLLIKMSREYRRKRWVDVTDLPGIGQYGRDAWRIFVEHDLSKTPKDAELAAYVARLRKEVK